MQAKKNIFLVRHAQTVLNAEQIIQGQSFDSDLSEAGILQAKLLYTTFQSFAYDKIYISGLRRTRDSVKNFIDANTPYEVIQELNEINWGIIEGNKLVDVTKHRYLETITSWKNGDYNAKIEDGESALDVAKRLSKAISIFMRNENEKNILLVSHSRTLKILLCILLEIEIKKMDIFNHKNLTLYKILYQNQKYRLSERLTLG